MYCVLNSFLMTRSVKYDESCSVCSKKRVFREYSEGVQWVKNQTEWFRRSTVQVSVKNSLNKKFIEPTPYPNLRVAFKSHIISTLAALAGACISPLVTLDSIFQGIISCKIRSSFCISCAQSSYADESNFFIIFISKKKPFRFQKGFFY